VKAKQRRLYVSIAVSILGQKRRNKKLTFYCSFGKANINLLRRLVARMGASHAPGRGSIPRGGNIFLQSIEVLSSNSKALEVLTHGRELFLAKLW
jgi:hypothetical protein